MMSNRNNMSRMFFQECSENTFLTDGKNKPVNNTLLCFGVWISGHSEQHHFKQLARFRLMT